MKIRTGFVSNSSSSSFVVLVKNNTSSPVPFNTFVTTILGKHKQFPYIRKVIAPGYNRFILYREDDGSSEYDEMIHMLGSHGTDPKNKFEWYITQAGDWTGIKEDTITWMRPHGADSRFKRMHQKDRANSKEMDWYFEKPEDMYLPPTDILDLERKKKSIKSKSKRKPIKKVVKKKVIKKKK